MSAVRNDTGFSKHGGLRILREVVIPGSTAAKGEGDATHRPLAHSSALFVVSVDSANITE